MPWRGVAWTADASDLTAKGALLGTPHRRWAADLLDAGYDAWVPKPVPVDG